MLAQQDETYDYWQHQREMVRRGQQAIFMCNGLFTSNRSLEQVYEKELAFLPEPVGTPAGGDYTVFWDLRAVEIGKAGVDLRFDLEVEAIRQNGDGVELDLSDG